MNTLFDKIWDSHIVDRIQDGPQQIYIDRLYCHEVTSPQAFEGLRARGIKCFRPERIFCMPDHNTPTHDQDKPVQDPVSRKQLETLDANVREFGLTYFGMMDPRNCIIHVVGPEQGLDKVLEAAGFEIRQPGCSACLAMNDDKVPSGKYCVSTSNRNFEGRQGPGARTLLASPLTAAAAAVTGCVTDPRDLL